MVLQIIFDNSNTFFMFKTILNYLLYNSQGLPKWMLKAAKLMSSDENKRNDWQTLARRLGYSKQDIKRWENLQNPCAEMLEEWMISSGSREDVSEVFLRHIEDIGRLDVKEVILKYMAKGM